MGSSIDQTVLTPDRIAAVPPARLPLGPPFVGRDAQITQLMRLLGAAERGEAQLAVIEGPAGIGKTRLATEMGARARRRGARVAIGRCWQGPEAPPLWPWRAILRDLGAPETLLKQSSGMRHERSAPFVAVLDHLRIARGDAPLVIILDDAQRADATSLLLAGALVRERALPLLMVLTCRQPAPGTAPDVFEILTELGRDAVSVPLAGLSEEAVGAYLAAADAPSLHPELLQAVTAVTNGNPLELRTVALEGEPGRDGVQQGLERAIRRSLDRLPAVDRRLIAEAALLGPEVSVHEVARVAGASPALVAEALARAAERGLARASGAHRFRFVHEAVRRMATSTLAVRERLDAHARAAALLRSDDPDGIALQAHHALAAASRSKDDAERAVAIAREAARSLRAVDRFGSAAALLARAAEIHAEARAGPAAELLVERAECVLACGRLADSRPLFQHAARVAEREENATVLARAALGLGGVWVSEHRRLDEAEGALALQRRALEALPAEETVLRARLSVRLAAEAAYRGGPVAAVLDALERARQTGEAAAIAEALSLTHHVLLTPEHAWRRPAMASELIAAAAAAGDALLSLVGLCWRAADLFLLGDPGAGAALEELRVRAEALRCGSVLFIVRAIDVMRAIRAGELAKAEAAAAACFALGSEVGDADALAYHGAHLAAIRCFQGREAELADLAAQIASSPTLIDERERAFVAAAALFALRAGRPQPGRALLQRLARDGIASVPTSSSWLAAMLSIAELAFALDDRRAAQEVYDALLPYADLPIMASLGIVCLGSVHRPLGLAALTCAKLDLAIEHFAAAVAADEELGHRPAAIQAQAELGLARLRRASKGDDPRGRALLQDAIAAGEAAGMTGLVDRWRTAADANPSAGAWCEPGAALMTLGPGRRWRVVFEGQVATVPDRVGMRYLNQLVAAPGRGIPALALVVQGATDRAEHRPDPVMDRKTVAALQERIRDLHRREGLSPRETAELATLTRELARATGLGGRVRSFVDAPERARTAVRKSIKRAIDEISCAHPALGRHLALRIETGAVCCYRPEPFDRRPTATDANGP